MSCGTTPFNPVTFAVSLLLSAVIIFGVGYLISRFGASVEPLFQRLSGKYMLPAAKGIAWFCCVLYTFVFGAIAIKGIIRTETLAVVPVLFPVSQLFLLLVKKYRASFYLTIPELLVLALAWFGFLYSDPDSSRFPPYSIEVGGLGFWLFLGGAGLLFFGVWICNEAAKQLKKMDAS
ncbi:MAG: hypothetical protein FD189_2407 [Elusimicrobia bacterium]|nr:MAG: hypothetical protein FD154_2274 [Elusimicrobiota bacterium]KAF0153182.1 MAG: hypothetical protein FD189_2407 [Elusimicrobiota bacterium]